MYSSFLYFLLFFILALSFQAMAEAGLSVVDFVNVGIECTLRSVGKGSVVVGLSCSSYFVYFYPSGNC